MRPFEKWTLLVSAGATLLTGVVYAWMRYLMEPVDEWAVIHHPLEPWVLKAHILVAPVLLFAVGMVAVGHVWKHYRSRIEQGRRSGLLTASVFVPMALSGYLIQVATVPALLTAFVGLHLASSALFVLGLLLHWREFLRRRAAPRVRPALRARVHDG